MRLIKILFFIVSFFIINSTLWADTLVVKTTFSYSNSPAFWKFKYNSDDILITSLDNKIISNATIFLAKEIAEMNFLVQSKLITKKVVARDGVLFAPESFIPINYIFDSKSKSAKKISVTKTVLGKKSVSIFKQLNTIVSDKDVLRLYPVDNEILEGTQFVLRRIVDSKGKERLIQIFPINQPYWIYEKTGISESVCIGIVE